MLDENRASDANVLAHFQQLQCSAQWRVFLSVMAEQLVGVVGEDELRALMFRIGRGMAKKLELPDATSISDLAGVMNNHWEAMQFGWMELIDGGKHLEIQHHCSPLISAFGEDGKTWCYALLEGAYAEWFKEAGAGDELVLRFVALDENLAQTMNFRLAHPTYFD